MTRRVVHMLGLRITNDSFDAKFGQFVCFAAAVLMMVLSFLKLTRLDLTEAQLFFGMLLSLIVPLLLIIIGLLLPVARAARGKSV